MTEGDGCRTCLFWLNQLSATWAGSRTSNFVTALGFSPGLHVCLAK
jgi:hypothetical protein